jgi:threonine aldolase
MKKPAPLSRRQFGSDNFAGICPEAWAALAEANAGHVESYGTDEWTDAACRLIREVFETECDVFFVFNGTAANSLALAALCQPYQCVLSHEHAHVEEAECGGPEFFSGGSKVRLLPGANGKLDPATVERAATSRPDFHFPKPGAVTLAQCTEHGTVYSPDEVRALAATTHRLGMKLHMDGARFANAVAWLGVAPREITWQAGVDVLSFGATKNGISIGEAVVFFNRELARDFDYRAKQAGQLASKLRFIAAQWVGILADGAWLRHARHANAMAQRLWAGARGVPGVTLSYPCESNALFVRMPEPLVQALYARGWMFYQMHNEPDYRLMCSWDTTEADVDALLKDMKALAGQG